MTIPAHAELGIAFFQGKTLQFKIGPLEWADWEESHCPQFHSYCQWRIKPTPKVTRYLAYEDESGWLHWRRQGKVSDMKRIPALDKEITEE